MEELSEPLTLEEELFCARYELEILLGIIKHNRLERWLPGYCYENTDQEHVLRYDWVKAFVENKVVLDVACGAGFGSFKLASEGNASKVIGWDIDDKTIEYATLKNRHPKVFFEVKNAEAFDTAEQYDVIISFETIEHLNKPEAFLNNIDRALASSGTCFISTPISNMSENRSPDNIYHKREWGFKRFQKLVENYLTIRGVYLQLYKAEPVSSGLFSNVLHRTRLRRNAQLGISQKLMPHAWDPEKINQKSIGRKWIGYQILQCTKKAGAGL